MAEKYRKACWLILLINLLIICVWQNSQIKIFIQMLLRNQIFTNPNICNYWNVDMGECYCCFWIYTILSIFNNNLKSEFLICFHTLICWYCHIRIMCKYIRMMCNIIIIMINCIYIVHFHSGTECSVGIIAIISHLYKCVL